MRARGTGSINPYTNAQGVQLWRLSCRIAGRERSRASFESKAAAAKAASAIIKLWRQEADAERDKAERAPSWSDALAQTIAERGPRGAWRDRTVETYTGLGKPITKALGANTSLDDLSRGDIRKLYAEMIRTRSRGTVGLMASLVRGVFLTMLLDERIAVDIAAGVPVPASTKPKRQAMVWSAEQAREFLAATSESRWSALWRLWLASGARRGELLGLQWRNVDADAGTIRLEQTLHRVDYKESPRSGRPRPSPATGWS